MIGWWYGVEEVNPENNIVNPCYKTLSYRIKKIREKIARLKAKLFTKIEINLAENIDTVKEHLQQESQMQEALSVYSVQADLLCKERKETPYYIKVKDMPIAIKFNKLKTESKLFMNTIRMIVYRAETSVANLLAPNYSKSENEIRILVKKIISSDADLIPDYEGKTLLVRLHSLSTPRANHAVNELCAILNETETIYSGTDLKLIYECLF